MGEQTPRSGVDILGFDKYSVTVEYTEEFLKNTFDRLYRVRLLVLIGLGLFLIIFILTGAGTSTESFLYFSPKIRYVVGCAIGLTVFLLEVRFVERHKATLAMEDRHVTFQFGEEGIRQTMSFRHLKVKWSTFENLRRYDDLWVFYPTGKSPICMPAALLTPELQEFVVHKCSDNGVKVK